MFASELGDLLNSTVAGGNRISSSNLVMTSNISLLRNVVVSQPSTIMSGPLTTTTAMPVITHDRTSLDGSHGSTQFLSPVTDPHNLEHLFRPDIHHVRPDSQTATSSSSAVPEPSDYTDLSKKNAGMKKEHLLITDPARSSSLNKPDSKASVLAVPAQTSHPRGTLRCPFCDKVFSNSSAIAKHKLTHSEERKYVCSICHKAFKRQDHLNGHKYTHESKKPHACHFCDKSYSDARSLRRHYENAHPEEYERWLILSQATNGDPCAITVAAVALLSSGLVEKKEPGQGNVSSNAEENVNTTGQAMDTQADPTTLLNALNNPVCKLLASSLTRATTQNRTDDSPASTITIDGQASNNEQSSILRRPEHKHRDPLSRSNIPGAGSPHSPNSGCCSLSSVASPTGTMDTADYDETEDRSKSGTSSIVPPLSSLTPAEMETATKVALMMVHPLEAPKRVACKVCRKRFKNQSALNGHMRLHGGYGPAGLTAPHAVPSRTSEEQTVSNGSTVQLDVSSSHTRSMDSQAFSSGRSSSRSYPSPLPAVEMTNNRLDSHDMARLDEVLETLSSSCSQPSVDPHSTMRAKEERIGSSSSLDVWTVTSEDPQREHASTRSNTKIEAEKLSLPSYPTPPSYPSGRSGKTSSATLSSGDPRRAEQCNWHVGQTNWWQNTSSVAINDTSISRPQPSASVPAPHDTPWWKPPTTTTVHGTCDRFNNRPVEQQRPTSSDSQRPMSSDSHSSGSGRNIDSRTSVRSDNKLERTGSLAMINHNCSEEEWRRRISETTGLTDGYDSVLSHRGLDPHSRVDVCAPQSQQPISSLPPHHPNSSSVNKTNIVPRSLTITSSASGNGYIESLRDPLRSHFTLLSGNSSSSGAQQSQAGLQNQYSPVTPASEGTSLQMDSGEHSNTVFAFPPSEQHMQSLSAGLPSYYRGMAHQQAFLPNNAFMGNTIRNSQLATMLENRSFSSGLVPQQLNMNSGDPKCGVPPNVHLQPHQHPIRHSASIPQLGHPERLWSTAPVSKSEPGLTNASHASFDGHQYPSFSSGTRVCPSQFSRSVAESIVSNPSCSPQLSSSVASISGCNARSLQTSLGPPWAHPVPNYVDSTHNQMLPDQPPSAQQSAAAFPLPSYARSPQHTFGPRRGSLQQEQPERHFTSLPTTSIPTLHSSQSHPTLHERHSFPMDYTYQPRLHTQSPYTHHHGGSNYSVPEEGHARFVTPSSDQQQRHNTHLMMSQQPLNATEPERTRHISAPLMQPCVSYSHSDSHCSVVTLALSSATRSDAVSMQHLSGHAPHTSRVSVVTNFMTGESESARMQVSPDLTTSDAVADLLMQSHITEPQTFTCTPTQLGNTSLRYPLHIDADYANQMAHNSRSTFAANTCNSGVGVNDEYKTVDQMNSNDANTTPNTGARDSCLPLTGPERFELADLAIGSGSADESDNSAVTRLSKSLAEDNLFRNPHTLPPPKKFKRKPAPIFIPPQTSANLSRLRSPRVWTSECSSMGSTPPPYTPPPMLSPNRRGSGLFSSLTRWSSIASPSSLNRRNSSYYPSSASGDYFRRRSLMVPSSAHGTTPNSESEGALKRSYMSSMTGSSSSQTITCSVEVKDNQEGRRPFAFPRRRRQLTPKSAPMVLLDTSSNEKFDLNTDSLAPQAPAQQDTRTVFGYDDETMRKFAEADAADRARRLGRRRCDTDNHRSVTAVGKSSMETGRQDAIPEKLTKLEQGCDTLMNYKSEDALELVQDTLASLDEEMQTAEVYMDEEDELDEEDEEEEGLPSSLIPRINIGDAFQAEIPDYCPDRAELETEAETRETLLWFPANLDDRDPKNIESLNLLMKIACSPAVRSCGLNMEYTFHLLCKYKGNLEMTLHALLYETLVVYDYVYAETTAWTTEEIARFQHGLRLYGRDFHQVSKDLQANGMNKTVKACVEFYYVWKRMNTPSDVKWYREKARRQRLARTDHSDLPGLTAGTEVEMQPTDSRNNTQSTNNQSVNEVERSGLSTYNLRRKPANTKTEDNSLPDRTADIAQLDDLASLELDNLPVYDSAAPPDLGLLAQVEEEFNLANGADGGYPCHICHRVFSKIKSRSAHMKSHSDRTTNHRALTAPTRTPIPYAK